MYALALIAVLLGGWEAAVRGGLVEELILPAPSSIAEALYDGRSGLAHDFLVTASEAVLGLLAAAAAGALIALAMHRWRTARQALYPLAVGSQAVPMVVLAVPLILIFGLGLGAKVLVVAVVCFFPVTVTLYDGLRSVDADQRKVLRSLHASRGQTLRLLELPASLPRLFSGLRIAAAVSVIGAVFGEYAGSENGLGHVVLISYGQLESARTFAATVLLFVLAVLLYGAFALAERRLVDWKP